VSSDPWEVRFYPDQERDSAFLSAAKLKTCHGNGHLF
jgi:hypothetical protein